MFLPTTPANPSLKKIIPCTEPVVFSTWEGSVVMLLPRPQFKCHLDIALF